MSSIVYKIVSSNGAVDYISLEYMREFLSIYKDVYGVNSKIKKILIYSKGVPHECSKFELGYLRDEIKTYQRYMNKILMKLNHPSYSKNIEFGMDNMMDKYIEDIKNMMKLVGCSQC